MTRADRPFRVALVLPMVMVLAGTTACGGSKDTSGDTDQVSLPPVKACPSAPATSAAFPTSMSARLPHPAYATDIAREPVSDEGVDLLKFTTPMSLGSAAAFVLKEYPAAGYQIVQGDSEEHEADIPFVKGDLHGKLRLSGTADCSTTWLLATVDGSATDLGDLPGLGEPDDGH